MKHQEDKKTPNKFFDDIELATYIDARERYDYLLYLSDSMRQCNQRFQAEFKKEK